MPQYSEVDWEQASCSGVYTDLFYRVEEERNADAYNYINAVRSICGRCPIWEQCLTYAFAWENYGVWGGLTSMERAAFVQPKKYPTLRQRALKALMDYGITLERINQAYEHSRDVGSMENAITNYRENGVISHSRSRR